MFDDTFQTNETELSTKEEINELIIEQKTKTEVEVKTANQPSLRERVFQTCDNLESKQKKITRDIVRGITKGSDRDLSKYIKEWREGKNKRTQAMQGSTHINPQTSKEVEQKIPINFNQELHQDDAKTAMEGAARRAAEIIITEEKLMQYYLQNPDQLPDELKQEVAQAQKDTHEMLKARSMMYEVENFTELVLSSLQN